MIQVDRPHLLVAAATHPGMKGKLNEDRFGVTAFQASTPDRTPSVLALLADGIGGHHAGEVAAQLAVDEISQYIAANSTALPLQALKYAFTQASRAILEQSLGDPTLNGMGTTCVAAWVVGNRLFCISMGDSRLYLQRGGRIACLTIDHTWVQEELTQGNLTRDQVKGHPNAHIIRRFLGSVNEIVPDLRLRLRADESDGQSEANQGMLLKPGDRLLLCSDGLTDLVSDGDILDILRTKPLEQSTHSLIDLANQRGGHDNITVVILQVPQPADITRPIVVAQPALTSSKPRKARTASAWLMLGLLLLAICLTIGLLAYSLLY